MTTNTKPTHGAAVAAIAPVVALATVLQKKGILSMADLCEELSMIELQATASNTASGQSLGQAARAAKDLLRRAGFYAYVASLAQELVRIVRTEQPESLTASRHAKSHSFRHQDSVIGCFDDFTGAEVDQHCDAGVGDAHRQERLLAAHA